MPLPTLMFDSPEQELQHGVKVLMQAGFTPQQIEQIRDHKSGGFNRNAYSKEMLGLRRWMVQELLAASLSNRQIANILQLSKETVNGDRLHNRALYTEEILKNQDTHRARLLKEQMELKDMALDAFDKSKKKKTTTVSDDDKGGSSLVRIEESAGDSAFLNVAKNSLVEQAKLLGLNELKVVEQQDKNYRSFLKDLTATIEKEKEANATNERRANALPAEAISFDIEEEAEPLPDTMPLRTINDEDY